MEQAGEDDRLDILLPPHLSIPHTAPQAALQPRAHLEALVTCWSQNPWSSGRVRSQSTFQPCVLGPSEGSPNAPLSHSPSQVGIAAKGIVCLGLQETARLGSGPKSPRLREPVSPTFSGLQPHAPTQELLAHSPGLAHLPLMSQALPHLDQALPRALRAKHSTSSLSTTPQSPISPGQNPDPGPGSKERDSWGHGAAQRPESLDKGWIT